MKIVNKKITFGLILGVRGFFNKNLAKGDRRDILALLDRLGCGAVVTEEGDTPSGSIETLADAKLCAELFRKHREEIDGVIVLLPNFGDEVAVAETLKRSALGVPVLVQASNDELDKVDLDGRRDSFCGKISVCNNLYQYGIPFTATTLHTCDVAGEAFEKDVVKFAGICRTVKGLRNARIGLFGPRPAAFQTMRVGEKLLQRTGITVLPTDMTQVLAVANAVNTSDRLYKKRLDELRGYGKIQNATDDVLEKSVRFAVALERFMEDQELDASAVQCWDSLQNNYGCAPCVTMSMMGERMMPSACEGDVAGAVSMYALLLASGKIPGLLDWNNNYGGEADICANTHCGNYPGKFMETDIEVGYLDVLSRTIDKSKCFGAVKGRVAPGGMTFFRISTDETRGFVKAYVGEGQFIDKPFDMAGGIAICKIPNLQKLMRTICRNGFEHHVAMTRSLVADILFEAAARYLGWKLYWHEIPDIHNVFEF
jgi:L-fucose isomerase-like protein